MKITQTIADVKEVNSIMTDNFADNSNKWQYVEDEDEYARVEDGHYIMKNFTETRWMYYDRPSKAGLEDDFIIDAVLCAAKDGDFSNYGLLWGFEKYPESLNRFVIDSRYGRVTVTSFFMKNDSETIERISKKSDNVHKGGEKTNRLVILKLKNKLFFFVNDLTEPIFERNADFFSWSGNRIGFYTEPGMEVVAKSISVKKIICDESQSESFKELIERSWNF